MDFYEILQEIMDEKDMNIPDVARACGLSDGTVRSMLVRKSKNVTLEVAIKLSDGLNVSLERLNGLPEKDESPAPAEASTGDNHIDVQSLYGMLVENGFVKQGDDLTDEDLRFLLSVGDVIHAWFTKGNK